MQIIEILPELDIGGVERHVIDLSNELAARGHDVIVISAGGALTGTDSGGCCAGDAADVTERRSHAHQ